jgi:8-oxo-dGTP diphosphatase
VKEYVCGFMRNDANVLLLTKARPKWQEGRLNGVGGKLKFLERPYEAMVREFEEEVGIRTVEADWRCSVILQGKDWRVYFSRAFATVRYELQDYENLTTDEPTRWYPMIDLWKLPVIGNLRWLIPLCFDNDLRFPITIHDDSKPQE